MLRTLLLSLVAATVAGASPPTLAVKVTVSGGGKPVGEAYVSFVTPDRPAWRPAAETIARDGSAIVQLRPGSYRVFAGARGFQETIRAVEVREATALTFDLQPSVRIGGVVVDPRGRPIAGAEVRHLRAAGAVQSVQVSELARRFFATDWVTRTNEDGAWTLPARSDGSIPVVIEARGFAPAQEMRAGASADTTTTLQPGGSLSVTLDRAAPDQVLTLTPLPVDERPVAPAPWQATSWSRSAGTAQVAWEALPPGTYGLTAHPVDARHFTSSTKLGSFVVREGEAAEARVTLPRLPPLHPEALALFVPGRSARDLVGVRAIVSTSRGADEVGHAFERTSGGTLIYLRTTATPSDIFVSSVDTVITAGVGGEGTVDAPLTTVSSPRADMTLALTVAPGAPPLPLWASAHFTGCASPRAISLAVSPSREGTLHVPFPTSCRGVVIRLPPFAPVVLEPALAPREAKAFGPIPLVAGASARVQVVREASGSAVPAAVVRALSASDRGDELVFGEGVAGDDGKLVIAGLPPEVELTIEARDPASELTGSLRTQLTAAEERVQRVTISDPATLVVEPRIAAALRERFPEARVHSVTIDRADTEDRRARRTAALNARGEAEFRGLAPGRWQTLVLVEAGGAIQPVPLADNELAPGAVVRIREDVSPPVFSGRVVSARRGVEAQIGFGEPPGPEALTRFARSGADGRFAIMLPSRGTYRVSVTPLDRPDTRVDVGELLFDEPSRSVTIELPTAELVVRVTDGDTPADAATVDAVLRRATAYGTVGESVRRATTSADGTVRFDNLLPGSWLLQAAHNGKRGDAVVDVRAGQPASAELELRGVTSFSGVVRHANGTAAAATISCLYGGSGGVARAARAQSDATGKFSIDLPAPAPARLQCGAVTAAGEAGIYSVSPAAAVELLVAAGGGSLVIADWAAAGLRDAFWLVASDGRTFNLSWASARVGGKTPSLTIRGIPAGSWKLVRATRPEDFFRLATGAGAGLPTIADFRIEPAEVETVHLQSSTRNGGRF